MLLIDSSPLQVPTLSEAIHKRLLNAIVAGEIPPGTQVTIAQLAEQFGVSLMPVRDALKRLEAASLISQQKNRRIIVKELPREDLNALLEIRLNLECMAAKKATKKCTDETTAELDGVLQEMKQTQDQARFLENNKRFHHILYRASNTLILQEIIEGLWLRLSPYLHLYALKVPDYQLANEYHSGILRGLRERDSKKVCKYLRLDLKHGARVVNSLFRAAKAERRP